MVKNVTIHSCWNIADVIHMEIRLPKKYLKREESGYNSVYVIDSPKNAPGLSGYVLNMVHLNDLKQKNLEGSSIKLEKKWKKNVNPLLKNIELKK